MTYEQLRAFATENLDTAFWTSRSKTSQRPNEWSDIPEDESAAEPSALDKVHSLATMGEIIFSPFTGEYAVLVPRVNVDAARLERFSKLLQAVAISEYDRGQNGHPAFFDSYLEEFVSFEVRIVRIKTESQAEAPISAVVHNTLLGKARAWVEKQRNRFSK